MRIRADPDPQHCFYLCAIRSLFGTRIGIHNVPEYESGIQFGSGSTALKQNLVSSNDVMGVHCPTTVWVPSSLLMSDYLNVAGNQSRMWCCGS